MAPKPYHNRKSAEWRTPSHPTEAGFLVHRLGDLENETAGLTVNAEDAAVKLPFVIRAVIFKRGRIRISKFTGGLLPGHSCQARFPAAL